MLYTSNNLVRKLEIYAVNQNYHTLLMNNLSRYNWKGDFFYYLLFIFWKEYNGRKERHIGQHCWHNLSICMEQKVATRLQSWFLWAHLEKKIKLELEPKRKEIISIILQ